MLKGITGTEASQALMLLVDDGRGQALMTAHTQVTTIIRFCSLTLPTCFAFHVTELLKTTLCVSCVKKLHTVSFICQAKRGAVYLFGGLIWMIGR